MFKKIYIYMNKFAKERVLYSNSTEIIKTNNNERYI